MPQPILRVENLHYSYPSQSAAAVAALRGVTFDVHPHEYLVILGRNGSGKSTLARTLNGLLQPSSGDVWVKQWNTREYSHRLDIRTTVGLVFQNPDNQIIATIVEEDVAFGPENLGIPFDELRQRVDWALGATGLLDLRKRAPHLLSGGQKQRVAIAGILALRPEVLVLDEATALLDPQGRQEILNVAHSLNRQGITVVEITHFMQDAVLADRIIILDQGSLVIEGTPAEVFGQAVRLRELSLDVPEITQLADRLHLRIPALPGGILTVQKFVDSVMELLPAPV